LHDITRKRPDYYSCFAVCDPDNFYFLANILYATAPTAVAQEFGQLAADPLGQKFTHIDRAEIKP
jgi:hypothetical protein